MTYETMCRLWMGLSLQAGAMRKVRLGWSSPGVAASRREIEWIHKRVQECLVGNACASGFGFDLQPWFE
jgi:hypothetical protein